jgi:hypothetical protein
MAKYIGNNLGLDYMGPVHIYSILTLMLFIAYFMVSSILSIIF